MLECEWIIRDSDLDKPFETKEPYTWKLQDDLFNGHFTDMDIAGIYGIMLSNPQHSFLIFTRHPERMKRFFDWMDGAVKRVSVSRGPFRFNPVLNCLEHVPLEIQICQEVVMQIESLFLRPGKGTLKHGVYHRLQYVSSISNGKWPLENVKIETESV